MVVEQPTFILAGNGPYENRGCEAIVRGTVKIIQDYFTDPRFICFSHFQSEEQYKEQCLQETDDAIVHLASLRFHKKKVIQTFWKPETMAAVFGLFFNKRSYYKQVYREMVPYLNRATAVLSVGGDNYTIDYGVKPTSFTSLDDLVLAHDRPLVIWGASIGPFSKMPDYEQYMSNHLNIVTGIFARESATTKYLESIGVRDNVHPVADPAFLMDPVKPARIEAEIPIEKESIGLNFSPLMARYVTDGNLKEWTDKVGSIIVNVAENTGMPIFLIPHVTSPRSNDYSFMQRALSLISQKDVNITLVPPLYNAAETKWIISQMALFAGARTHATIAALSSSVPTLSFAYSVKARGINRDVFGHTEYCMDPKDLDAKKIGAQIVSMMNQKESIKASLRKCIPDIQMSARKAGMELKQLLDEN